MPIRLTQFFISLVFLGVLTGCQTSSNITPTTTQSVSTNPPTQPSPTPKATPSSQATMPIAVPSPTNPMADVTINPMGISQPSTIRVGQVLAIPNLGNTAGWQVSFSPDYLTALTPSETMTLPGPVGWLFKAIKPGQVDLMFTSIVTVNCDKPPCPPAPMPQQFVITLTIQP